MREKKDLAVTLKKEKQESLSKILLSLNYTIKCTTRK